MLNLPQETFKKIKRVLQRQEREIEKNIKSIEKDDPVKGDGLAESSEPGTDSWVADVHGRAEAIKVSLQTLLARTKNSLANLRSGKYGKCENCGKQIQPQRLEAIPTATLCLSCSKKKTKR
ncbi:MAG: TraR/DksA family transcriptional regulator [Microgenomates group bacterium Gr01-1014_80]|nr:MAG: TraR/DksA family transcriptional regulator [Microgenomates group bacterium Gr01-1014_80]